MFLNTLYNSLLNVAPRSSRSFLTMSAIALNFSWPSRDHPLPLSLCVVLSYWRRTPEKVYCGTLMKRKCIVLMHRWWHNKTKDQIPLTGMSSSSSDVIVLFDYAKANWSSVSIWFAQSDHTCTSLYLCYVVSVLCLPTSRIIIKHNQQKCFVADWQHKALK